ncbi:hypothetical protein O1L60_23395 [Streptomyces diastatochromogenes]|nr:hypothetical protein [Streptomyces diastatochromogenes]
MPLPGEAVDGPARPVEIARAQPGLAELDPQPRRGQGLRLLHHRLRLVEAPGRDEPVGDPAEDPLTGLPGRLGGGLPGPVPGTGLGELHPPPAERRPRELLPGPAVEVLELARGGQRPRRFEQVVVTRALPTPASASERRVSARSSCPAARRAREPSRNSATRTCGSRAAASRTRCSASAARSAAASAPPPVPRPRPEPGSSAPGERGGPLVLPGGAERVEEGWQQQPRSMSLSTARTCRSARSSSSVARRAGTR